MLSSHVHLKQLAIQERDLKKRTPVSNISRLNLCFPLSINQEVKNPILQMAAESHQLHFLLVPFLCPGHLIPMADIAGVLAQHGVIVTIVTTPINAILTKPIIDRRATEGCESLESWSIVPSRALIRNFFDAVSKLQKPLEQLIEELELISTCILVDKFLYWAPQVLILSLPAVGAYLTNCVGNSTVEQICAGVPMITWPMFTDQFFNEKLIVQILETSERLGTEVAVPMGKQEKFGAMIKWDKFSEATDKVMREGTRKEENAPYIVKARATSVATG